MKPSRRGILAAFLGLPAAAALPADLPDLPSPAPQPRYVPDAPIRELCLRASLTDGQSTIEFPLLDVSMWREEIEVTSFADRYRQFMPGRTYREVTAADPNGILGRQIGRWMADRTALTFQVGAFPVRGLRMVAEGGVIRPDAPLAVWMQFVCQ